MKAIRLLTIFLLATPILASCGNQTSKDWHEISHNQMKKIKENIVSNYKLPKSYNAKYKDGKTIINGQEKTIDDTLYELNKDEGYFKDFSGASYSGETPDLYFNNYVVEDSKLFNLTGHGDGMKEGRDMILILDDTKSYATKYFKTIVTYFTLRQVYTIDQEVNTAQEYIKQHEEHPEDEWTNGSYTFKSKGSNSLFVSVDYRYFESGNQYDNFFEIEIENGQINYWHTTNIDKGREKIFADRCVVYDYSTEIHKPDYVNSENWLEQYGN